MIKNNKQWIVPSGLRPSNRCPSLLSSLLFSTLSVTLTVTTRSHQVHPAKPSSRIRAGGEASSLPSSGLSPSLPESSPPFSDPFSVFPILSSFSRIALNPSPWVSIPSTDQRPFDVRRDGKRTPLHGSSTNTSPTAFGSSDDKTTYVNRTRVRFRVYVYNGR